MKPTNLFKRLAIVFLSIQILLAPFASLLAQEISPVQTTTTETTTVLLTPTTNDVNTTTPLSSPEAPVVVLQPVSTSSTADTVLAKPVETASDVTTTVEIPTTSLENIAKPNNEPVLELPKKLSSYADLMRRTQQIRTAKLTDRSTTINELENFISSEKKRLDELSVSSDKQNNYFKLLRRQLSAIDDRPQTTRQKALQRLKNIFSFDEEETIEPSNPESTISIPNQPASFKFNSDEIIVSPLREANKSNESFSLSQLFSKVFLTPTAVAVNNQQLPVLADVQSDPEVIITPEIKDLANSLNNNPLNILNFVRNTLTYEPYFGAKKGSSGCLQEKVCNDVDSSSLLIALLRSAGIPAHYKKSIIILPTAQLQSLLGVDETKTAFAALAWNKIPVYTLNDANAGKKLDEADFSLETELAMEWVFPEMYYDYDERGGNIDNTLNLATASTTQDLQTLLSTQLKKQWIPLDVIVRPYTHTKKEIVADAAQFNSQTFWTDYLKYQGNLSPLNKYAADLKTATGKDVQNANYQSTKVYQTENFSILPPTLPYYTRTGEVGGSLIQPETWSTLPEQYREKVKISLLKELDKSVVLEKTFYGSEINNQEFNLAYEGVSDTDKNTIQSYGGIASTPAALVDIQPVLSSNAANFTGNQPIKIGDKLIMQFEYFIKNNKVYSDQKFSIAGNSEGIYVSLSKVQDDPSLDTDSHILLRGNVGLARKYLQKIEQDGNTLKKSLDYEYNIDFSRAVVTQNRILTEVNGLPTTFDFKGLFLDASAYINDYSNRNNYRTHRQDFRLLWGENASYHEAQLFTDIAGLEGISTVKGLQYAYANPNTYTVYTITSSTPNYQQLIDSLQLSTSTKQNLTAAVQDNNTVITPNKMITNGVWNGLVYISLAPGYTGEYAIGERVGNGGWTTAALLLVNYTDGGITKDYYLKSDNIKRFIYEDRIVDSVKCRIDEASYTDIITDASVPQNSPAFEKWKPSYGAPCLKETKKFGTVTHTFILATNAAKFYSPSRYNYWVKSDVAKSAMVNANPGYSFKTFKFNIIAGTYSYHGPGHTAYYQPLTPTPIDQNNWTDNGKGWRVIGGILNKLEERSYKPEYLWCSPNDAYCSELGYKLGFVLNKIGYPTSNEGAAASSFPYGTHGVWQQFIGGQIYYETTWINHAYYVPGFIEKEYGNQKYCQVIDGNTHCGSGGTLGFPVGDPVYNAQLDMIFQDFENGTRVKEYLSKPIGQNIETVEDVQKIAILRNYTDPKYSDDLIEGMMDGFYEHDLYGVGVSFAAGLSVPFIVNEFKSYIVKKLGKTAVVKVGLRYVPLVGWIYSGVTVGLAIDQNWPLAVACNTDPDQVPLIDGKSPAYYCGKLGVNGVAFGLGAIANVGSSKIINRLGASTLKGKIGKSKLVNAVDNDNHWLGLKSSLTFNEKTRTAFYETVERWSPEDIKLLTSNSSIQTRLLNYQNRSALTTVNGFVKAGPLKGLIKYRVDPRFSSEFSAYTKPNAFSMPKLLQDGLTKPGFFGVNELGDAISIYNQKNLGQIVNGQRVGEIIFVKKLDGTTILTPRYSSANLPLPHPYLAAGDDVVAAGTIIPTPNSPKSITVDNATGHYKIHKDDIALIIQEFKNAGFSVIDASL